MSKNRTINPIPFILAIVFFIISIMTIIKGNEDNEEYQVIKDDLVEVSATVSKISVLKDLDGQDRYTALVTYYYDNQQYRNVGWKDISKGEYFVGQQVRITINPAEPNIPYIYSGDTKDSVTSAIVFAVIGCIMVFISFKKE